jgi:hypothetical protein
MSTGNRIAINGLNSISQYSPYKEQSVNELYQCFDMVKALVGIIYCIIPIVLLFKLALKSVDNHITFRQVK